jgi:hypothetical protein
MRKLVALTQQEPEWQFLQERIWFRRSSSMIWSAFWLKIFPITLGGGKRLFADGTIPAAFNVTESTVTSKGVIIVNYERAGAVPTGSL